MARLSFRDRFFTAPVARAMMSPVGIVLFGAATAVGIVAGAPIVAAVGLGAAVWAGKVALAVPKGQKSERIDPFVLSEPWRGYVQSAQTAKLRFDRTVQGTRPGPIRDRLAGLSDRLDEGIADCWRIASRGDDIDGALKHLNPTEAQLELAEARRQITARGATPALESTVASLEAQLASAQRMQAVSQDTRDRLRLLDARLDELVARSAEVSVGAGDTGGLSDEVDGVVTELEALRLALEETGGSRPATG
jgi:BMFP domain-containing protein YqiC